MRQQYAHALAMLLTYLHMRFAKGASVSRFLAVTTISCRCAKMIAMLQGMGADYCFLFCRDTTGFSPFELRLEFQSTWGGCTVINVWHCNLQDPRRAPCTEHNLSRLQVVTGRVIRTFGKGSLVELVDDPRIVGWVPIPPHACTHAQTGREAAYTGAQD